MWPDVNPKKTARCPPKPCAPCLPLSPLTGTGHPHKQGTPSLLQSSRYVLIHLPTPRFPELDSYKCREAPSLSFMGSWKAACQMQRGSNTKSPAAAKSREGARLLQSQRPGQSRPGLEARLPGSKSGMLFSTPCCFLRNPAALWRIGPWHCWLGPRPVSDPGPV